MAGLSCGDQCLKFLLFTFNLIFWIAGAGLMGVGIWLKVDPNAFHILSIIGDPHTANGFWNVTIWIIIGVGSFILLVGFLGCCGACMENRCMLLTYASIVGFFLVMEVLAVIFVAVFSSKIDETIENKMIKDVKTRYVDETSTDGVSVSWNYLQQSLRCCGGKNYTDYIGSNYTLTYPSNPVPYTCCFYGPGADRDPQYINACYQTANGTTTDRKYLYETGCYSAIRAWLEGKRDIIIAVACSIAGVQLFGLIFACVLQSSIKNSNIEDNKYV